MVERWRCAVLVLVECIETISHEVPSRARQRGVHNRRKQKKETMRGMKQNTQETLTRFLPRMTSLASCHTPPVCARRSKLSACTGSHHCTAGCGTCTRHTKWSISFIQNTLCEGARGDPGVICVHIHVQCSPQVKKTMQKRFFHIAVLVMPTLSTWWGGASTRRRCAQTCRHGRADSSDSGRH